jgi:thioredoxin 1
VKFNVENDIATPQRYGITAIPTLLFFKGGSVVQTIVGGQSKAKLEAAVQKVL